MGQILDRFFSAFFSSSPIAMMNMGAPDGAIEEIEIVIVRGDLCNVRGRDLRKDHPVT
jgi:hypothetical protein